MTTTADSPVAGIDLALSGGGVRAMAFHAGVLQFLAEQGALERVQHISTVSGGSLLAGLVFHLSAQKWPTSEEYCDRVLPEIKRLQTKKSLIWRAAVRLIIRPWNWRFVHSRANIISDQIRCSWGIRETLGDLPAKPDWSINATDAETGRRFRFKHGEIGGYEIGYADAREFPLSDAMATSAAFPGGIGPLSIPCKRYSWVKAATWNATREIIVRPFKHLHVYDGGLYDNLGLEPLFDVGKQMPKASGRRIIVSDAGAPLQSGFKSSFLGIRHVKRWLDICTEQQRALRVRSFVNALQTGVAGAYLQIGSCARTKLKEQSRPESMNLQWLTAEQTLIAAKCPTSLSKLSDEKFELLRRHGYETAHWNQLLYPYL